jgi:uncharacterized membrane protein
MAKSTSISPQPTAGETQPTAWRSTISPAQRWQFGLIVLIGIVLRFCNLLHKPVWIDEAFSLFHISGFTQAIASQHLVTGAAIQTHELLRYQAPHDTTNLMMTLRNIGDTAPELPPLYFALLYGWIQLFGSALETLRVLSGLFSVAALPAMYWLCLALFGRPIVGWYAMALMAVSPFHLLMAQEIRPYSLWTVLLILTTTLLVKAQRSGRWADWLAFSLGLTASFYTHVLTILPGLTYALASLLQVRGNVLHPKFRSFIGAIVGSAIGFLPWMWYGFVRSVERPEPYAVPHTSRLGIIQGVAQSLTRFFADFNLGVESPRWALAIYALLILGVFGLILKSLIHLWRQGPKDVRWLLLSLAIVPVLCLMFSDAALNTSRTLFTRYYIPSVIAIEVSIAYFIASRQRAPQMAKSSRHWQRRWWALLSVGILSCSWFVMSPNWWHKTRTVANTCIQQATKPIAGQPNATIVTDEFFMRSLGLAHQINAAVKFKFYPIGSDRAPAGINQAPSYLYMPSEAFATAMDKRYNLKPVCPGWL